MADSVTSTHVCSWGIDYSTYERGKFLPSGANGILYGVDESVEPILAPEHNEIGQVIAQTHYDNHGRISGTLQVAHGVELPGEATPVQIHGKYYYIVNASLSETNQTYDKYSVTLERYHLTSSASFVVKATGSTL